MAVAVVLQEPAVRAPRVLVPLLVERGGYMTQAATLKPLASQVRDEARIEDIVACGGEGPALLNHRPRDLVVVD